MGMATRGPRILNLKIKNKQQEYNTKTVLTYTSLALAFETPEPSVLNPGYINASYDIRPEAELS